jgi:hypothetical protein
MFNDVSKRIPEAFNDVKTARRHIITAANSGQAFTAEDICDKHKDVKSMTVKEFIAKFVAANILSMLERDMSFTRIWRNHTSVKMLNNELMSCVVS